MLAETEMERQSFLTTISHPEPVLCRWCGYPLATGEHGRIVPDARTPHASVQCTVLISTLTPPPPNPIPQPGTLLPMGEYVTVPIKELRVEVRPTLPFYPEPL